MGRHGHPADAVMSEAETPAANPRSPVRLAAIAGLMAGDAGAVVGWLSYRAYQTYSAEQQRERFLEVGRQAALNLTTVDR